MSTKRFILSALMLLAACAGQQQNTRSEPARADSNSEAPPPQKAEEPQKKPDSESPLEVVVKPVQNPGPRKRIGVLDFENASHNGWSNNRDAISIATRDAVSEALVKSGAFVVVEREQLSKVLGEHALGMTGALSAQSAAKAGQLLGLQALVTGKITDLNQSVNQAGFGGYFNQRTATMRARVSLRVIDATTGEVWSAESAEGTAESESTTVMGGGSHTIDENLGKRALYRAISNMIDKVVVKAAGKPWSGTVAKVSKGKIYITAGSDAALPTGATLVVRRLGEEITDPGTGQVIGRELGNVVGKLQVADNVNEKLSVCVALNGSGFNTGDVVAVDLPKP
jgi:curli biogenesis system outer membrane secretion channel CsgG